MSTSPEAPGPQGATVSRIEWWQAVRASSLPPRARLLAFVMSTYMDPDGTRCWPGQDALAAGCGWSDARSVRKAMQVLVAEGFVQVEPFSGPRPDGRTQATHVYRPTQPPNDQAAQQVQEDIGTKRPDRAGRSTTKRPTHATKRPVSADQAAPEGRQPPHDLTKDPTTTGAGDGLLDELLEDLPSLIAQQVQRTRRLRAACAKAAEAGHTRATLRRAVLAYDAANGPLDAADTSVAGALRWRITNAPAPPAPRDYGMGWPGPEDGEAGAEPSPAWTPPPDDMDLPPIIAERRKRTA